jgi:hypothetical protein
LFQGKDYDDMITKWRLNTKAVIKDGNLGRGADTLQGKDIILEVFSKGTAATGWEEVEHRHTDQDGVSLHSVCLSKIHLFPSVRCGDDWIHLAWCFIAQKMKCVVV